VTISNCYGVCQRYNKCKSFAFLEQPVIGYTSHCYLLSEDVQPIGNNRIFLVVLTKIFDVLEFLCPRKQSIRLGRKPNPLCTIKSIDGGWGQWSNYGLCSTTCNEGIRTRSRLCNKPYPSYGGDDCLIADMQTRSPREIEAKRCNTRFFCLPVFLMRKSVGIIKNQMVARLHKLRKSFTVKFYLRPTKLPPPELWHCIIRLTHVEDGDDMQQQMMGVWLSTHPTEGLKYFISFPINGSGEIKMRINNWNSISISQTNVMDKYFFIISINNVLVWRIENTTPREYQNVRLRLEANDQPQTRLKNVTIYNGSHWGAWSTYSKCAVSIGKAIRNRKRLCTTTFSVARADDCLLSDNLTFSSEEIESQPCEISGQDKCGDILHFDVFQKDNGTGAVPPAGWVMCFIDESDTAYHNTPCKNLLVNIAQRFNTSDDLLNSGGNFGCWHGQSGLEKGASYAKNNMILKACVNNRQHNSKLNAWDTSKTTFAVCIKIPKI
jgi:hypothetical protein